jgi:hypothetical protein
MRLFSARPSSLALLALLALPCLMACTPSHNWRTVRVGPADSLFPCKPVTAERAVALAGGTRSMSLTACAVDEVTYAVSWVQATSAADAAQVAQALRDTQATNWRANGAAGTSTLLISAPPAGAASVLQGVVIGAPGPWQQAQRAGLAEQFLASLKVTGARP